MAGLELSGADGSSAGIAGTPLPRPDRGPFSVDLDELFVQASATVGARTDLVEGLEAPCG